MSNTSFSMVSDKHLQTRYNKKGELLPGIDAVGVKTDDSEGSPKPRGLKKMGKTLDLLHPLFGAVQGLCFPSVG